MTKATEQLPLSLVGKRQPKHLSSESYGLLLLLLSALLFSIMGCFIKLAVSAGLPSTELVLFRGIFQFSWVASAMVFTMDGNNSHNNDNDLPQQRKALILRPFGSKLVRPIVIARGMVGGLGFVLYYYTVSVLPLGDATTLLSLNPIVTVLAARIVLGERLYPSYVLAAAASVVGSILIAHPASLFGHNPRNQDHVPPKSTIINPSSFGYLTAMLGTCCGASVYILIRKAGKAGVHTLQLLFSWSVFGILFSGSIELVSSFVQTTHHANGSTSVSSPSVMNLSSISTSGWWYIVATCCFGSGAHFLMNYAGRLAPAGLTSIVRSSGILWAYLWQIRFFHEQPTPSTILGVFMTLVSLIAVAIQQQQQQKQKQQSGEDSRVHQHLQYNTNQPKVPYCDLELEPPDEHRNKERLNDDKTKSYGSTDVMVHPLVIDSSHFNLLGGIPFLLTKLLPPTGEFGFLYFPFLSS